MDGFSYYFRDSSSVKSTMKGLIITLSLCFEKGFKLCILYVGTAARRSFAGSICCESCTQLEASH